MTASSAWPPGLPPPRAASGPYRICLVCLGNICRSPMAETVLRAELHAAGLDTAVQLDSAGTGDWHVGGPMDRRACDELGYRGYDGTAHRARQFQPGWLAERDLVLAMDRQNLVDLRAMTGPADRDRIRLLRSFDATAGRNAEVPDPFYGESAKFGQVLDMIEAAAAGLVQLLADALR